jgi:hypothetical protein
VQFFYDKELTFALGVTVAVACFAKTLAKASVAPIAEAFGGYMTSLWFAAGMLVSNHLLYIYTSIIMPVHNAVTSNHNCSYTSNCCNRYNSICSSSSYVVCMTVLAAAAASRTATCYAR